LKEEKMKSLISLIAVVLVLVTSASAVTLIGLPMGAGQLGLSASYNTSSFAGGVADARLNMISGGFSYGLTDDLDFICSYKSATSTNYNVSGLAATYGLTGLNLLVKYTILNELKSGAPVSVAIGAGVVPFSVKVNFTHPLLGPMEVKTDGSRAGFGVLVSKLMIPFVPYFNVLYTKNGGNMPTQTEIDSAIGTYIALSKQLGFFVEYSNNAVTPDGGGTTVTSGAVELSCSYGL
jgi:hypothetical protein